MLREHVGVVDLLDREAAHADVAISSSNLDEDGSVVRGHSLDGFGANADVAVAVLGAEKIGNPHGQAGNLCGLPPRLKCNAPAPGCTGCGRRGSRSRDHRPGDRPSLKTEVFGDAHRPNATLAALAGARTTGHGPCSGARQKYRKKVAGRRSDQRRAAVMPTSRSSCRRLHIVRKPTKHFDVHRDRSNAVLYVGVHGYAAVSFSLDIADQ